MLRSALVAALMLSVACAPAATADRGPGPAFIVLSDLGDAVLLTWAPIPGADRYSVFRGTSWDDAEEVFYGSLPTFVDEDPSMGAVIYVIVGWHGTMQQGVGYMDFNSAAGQCIEANGKLQVRASLSGCLN